MTPDEPRAEAAPERDYRTFSPPVRLEETIAGVDPDPLPDAEDVRNLEQHRALRDD